MDRPSAFRQAARQRQVAELIEVENIARETERGRLDIQNPERAARQLIALLSAEANDVSMFGTVELSAAQIAVIVDENVEMFLRAYGSRRKVGARGLRMILEELMLDLMYHLPSQKKVKEFEVTREMVEKRSVTLAMMEKAG